MTPTLSGFDASPDGHPRREGRDALQSQPGPGPQGHDAGGHPDEATRQAAVAAISDEEQAEAEPEPPAVGADLEAERRVVETNAQR